MALSVVADRIWVDVADAAQVAAPGSYLTVDSPVGPLLIVRDGDRELYALANECPHRGLRMLNGRGSLRRVRCPWHGWTFSLDGSARPGSSMTSGACLPRWPARIERRRVLVGVEPASS